MKRFFPNGNGEEGFSYNDDDEDQEESEGLEGHDFMDDLIMENDAIDAMHLGLVEQQFKQMLLEKSAEIAKQDWMWYFRSPSTRIRRIEKVYERLNKLLNDKKKK